ncbi:MAG: multidrug effflux MFS transporter [Wenzhouxiangellaceae bacterium]
MAPNTEQADSLATTVSSAPDISRAGIGAAEFIFMMALMMALSALSIDIMLVALPAIDQQFHLSSDNHRQLMITFYMLGFALGQPLFGPLADRLGRKPVLAAGLVIFIVASALAAIASSYTALLAARIVQGIGASSPRILAITIIRDCSVGREMSRLMSFVMMAFIIVPILAPALGQSLLWLGDWPLMFWLLASAGVATLLWSGLRLRETRPESCATQRPSLIHSLGLLIRQPQVIGYTVASGFAFGFLLSYVGSAQQVFMEIYDLGERFVLAFGSLASVLAVASLTNAKLVRRLGMRVVCHSGVVGLVLINLPYLFSGLPEQPGFWWLYLYLGGSFYLLGLCLPNFNALAMEPLGRIAGIGAAFIGFYTTLAGAFFGMIFGQAYDGTVRPLVLAFFTLSLATLITLLITERGRLWQSH